MRKARAKKYNPVGKFLAIKFYAIGTSLHYSYTYLM